MNLLCKIGYHKWKYQKQRIMLKPLRQDNCGLDDMEMDDTIRLCDKCYKKEINIFRHKWTGTNFYTKEEKRDIILKKLIGKDT